MNRTTMDPHWKVAKVQEAWWVTRNWNLRGIFPTWREAFDHAYAAAEGERWA